VTSDPPAAPPDGLPVPQRYLSMAVILLGIAMSVLDSTVVNLALPGIVRDLHAEASTAVWIVTAYQVATLVLLLPCAMLGDRIGHRRVYLTGLVLFTTASLGCALAPTLGWLVVARTFQGLGAGGLMSVNGALVRLTYPSKKLGRGIAINSLVVATASVAGPSIAALVLSVASWPWLFAINLPIGIVVTVLGLKALPRNLGRSVEGGRLSAVDVALNVLMFGLVALGADALGTRLAGTGALLRPGAGALLLVAGVVAGVLYVRRQRRLAVPLFPLDLLRIPAFALSMCTSIGAFAAQTLAYTALPFLLLEAYGRSHGVTGLLITAWPIATVIVAPIVGRLIGRIADGTLGAVGLGLMACGLAALALLPADPGNTGIAWRMALCGLGFGLFQSPNNHTILTSAPHHRSGAASGMQGTARLTGQTIGAVLLAIIFSAFGAQHAQGPAIALGIAAALSVLAGALSGLRVRARAAEAQVGGQRPA
jgi:DHA2 family multidrug resistance protein-like MFS transporter